MNDEEINKLVQENSKRKLRRSSSYPLFELDNRNKPTVLKKKQKATTSKDTEETNQDFSHIDDPEERANAYKELVDNLNQI